ncbi:MAG: hypothetical protein RQ723_09590 [Desulfuromonadales bacterium]|nr:hypothetical protein [Desulfuromonadales bacterium]
MKRLTYFLLAVLVALTLSACAAATHPAHEPGAPIGAVNTGP